MNVTDEENEVQPEQSDIQSKSGPKDDRTIYNQLAAATATDEMASIIIEAIRDNAPIVRTELGKLSLTDSSIKPYTITEAPEVEARLILIRGKIWVPTSCVVDIIREVHAQKATGYPGRRKTAALLRRYFVWQSMIKDIYRYIDNCHACRRLKAPRYKLYGELQPLPVPQQRWKDILIDFVVGLPEAHKHTNIITVTDRLTKDKHYIACKEITSKAIA